MMRLFLGDDEEDAEDDSDEEENASGERGERAPALGRSDDAHAGRRGRSRVTLASSPSSEGIFVDTSVCPFVSRRWYLRRHPVTAAASPPVLGARP